MFYTLRIKTKGQEEVSKLFPKPYPQKYLSQAKNYQGNFLIINGLMVRCPWIKINHQEAELDLSEPDQISWVINPESYPPHVHFTSKEDSARLRIGKIFGRISETSRLERDVRKTIGKIPDEQLRDVLTEKLDSISTQSS